MGTMRVWRRNQRIRLGPEVAGWVAVLALAGAALLIAQPQHQARGPVVVLTVKGDVNPVLVGYIERGIREGVRRHAEMVLIRLDTPGGGYDTTRQIAQDFLASDVPIGVYVWPPGARAGSAGTYITIGAHVAAMAPETNMGSAHPIFEGGMPGQEAPQGEQLKTLNEKVTNDALALIRNLAQRNGRNAAWAQKAVTQSVSATATEAARLGAIDFVAKDLQDLLKQADGRKVQVASGERVLRTASAPVEFLPMNWRETLLYPLANPNVAYILLILGITGLIVEIKTPTFGGAGILGAICLILALFALSVLDVNVAGLALLLLGVGFFVGELFAPTHGLLTLGGVVSFTIGSLILIRGPHEMQVSRPLIAGVVLALVCFFVFVLGAIVKGHRRKVVTGIQGMIGHVCEVRRPLTPEGTVFAEGSLWTAECVDGTAEAGERVEVVEVEGLRLKVRRAADR
jgi:membrane-bound serine protease (ClpP class)